MPGRGEAGGKDGRDREIRVAAWANAANSATSVRRVRSIASGQAPQMLRGTGRSCRDHLQQRSWLLLRHVARFPVPFLSLEEWRRSMAKLYKQDRVAPPGQFEDPAVMVFADLRPVAFRQRHAQEIVRLGVFRRDADRVPSVDLGLGDGTLLQQSQSQVVRRRDGVGMQSDDAAQQGLGGVRPARSPAQTVKDRERVGAGPASTPIPGGRAPRPRPRRRRAPVGRRARRAARAAHPRPAAATGPDRARSSARAAARCRSGKARNDRQACRSSPMTRRFWAQKGIGSTTAAPGQVDPLPARRHLVTGERRGRLRAEWIRLNRRG